MAQIIDLYGFLAVLLRGALLTLEAVTVGGVIFLLVLSKDLDAATRLRCRSLLRAFAAALAVTAVAEGFLSTFVLKVTSGASGWADLLDTSFLRADALVALGALAIAIVPSGFPAAAIVPFAAAVLAGMLLTSHAFARLDHRPLLLFVTGLHHLATAAWVGGLPYFLKALRNTGPESALRIARRFSRIATVSVATLVGAGTVMGWQYIGSVNGIYGTAYGVMLGAKAAILGLLLILGASNFRLLRERSSQNTPVLLTVLRSVEVEVALGVVAILAASSLTSQPPALDLSQGRVTLTEIGERFTPKWPRLKTPPLESLAPPTPLNEEESKRFGTPLSYVPGASKYKPDGPDDIAWSEYNHHWAGLCVLAVGLLALIAQTRWGRWARHWPLAFLLLGFFLLVRSDPENWPLGPRGFWESFQVAEVAQHRIFVVLICAFAVFEWSIATGRSTRRWHALVFPAICMIGGGLLLTHTHSLGNIKQELLAEMSHTPIALLAATAAGARWLELRLPRKPQYIGFVWAISFVLIGLTLTFYRES